MPPSKLHKDCTCYLLFLKWSNSFSLSKFFFFFCGIFLIFMYAYITGFVVCVSKPLRQMEIGFVKLCLLPCWVLYFLLTFYLSNYCLDETCYFHIWLYTLVFFFLVCSSFFISFVWYRHGFKKGLNWSVRSIQLGTSLQSGPVMSKNQKWLKNRGNLKTGQFNWRIENRHGRTG